MKEILVVGGGFAGVRSATRAARAARDAAEEVRITLVSAGDGLEVRPRLYEEDPERKRVPLDRVLGPAGVRRVAATVTAIDTDARTVQAVDRNGEALSLPYDKLVLAAGSRLVRATFPGAEHLFDVDTPASTTALDHHARRLPLRESSPGRYTAVVVGAGFTGLEVATGIGERLRSDAAEHGEEARVVLVDRAGTVGPELGPGPRPQIDRALDELKGERRLGRTVASLTPEAVTLSDGEVIPAATAVWTAGMVAGPLTAQIPGERDRMERLTVDLFLRVPGVPDVYAAGDTAAALAEEGHLPLQSCRHAQPMGKFAGHNVVADLLGRDPLPSAPDPYGTCPDLGPAGAVVTRGWDRLVEMSGQEARAMKMKINTEWICPPVDDREAIFAQAGRFSDAAS